MDTSKLGDPEAVSTIKRLRRFQSVRMHQLCERWGDLLQTASEFDKSATFGQLSDIVEASWPLAKKNSDTVLMTLS